MVRQPPVPLVGDGLGVPCADGEERPYLNLDAAASTNASRVPGSTPARATSTASLPRSPILRADHHGEASTLGGGVPDLASARACELSSAARALGIDEVELHDYPDGALAAAPLRELADLVLGAVRRRGSDLLVVFDSTGVTGHPDHRAATRAALAAPTGLPVLAWTVTEAVARSLNDEFATRFVGRAPYEIDLEVPVDRALQLDGIRCHGTQSAANPVLWRRLELTGGREFLRWLRGPVRGRCERAADEGSFAGGAASAPALVPAARRGRRCR